MNTMNLHLVEGVQVSGLGRALGVEHEDNAVGLLLDGRPAHLKVARPAGVL